MIGKLTNRRHFIGALGSAALIGPPSLAFARDALHPQTADGRIAYVVCSDTASLAIVEIANGRTQASVAVGSSPSRAVADSARDRILVSNFGADSISVVDVRTRVVGAAFQTEQGPSMLALDALRRRLYVCNVVAGSVSVLDADSGASIARALCGTHPNGLTFDESRNEAYVVGKEPGIVYALSWENGNLRSEAFKLDGAVDSVVSDGSGTLAFASDALRGTLATIDARTRNVTAVVRGLSGPQGIALARDPHTLYVAESNSSTVAVVDLIGSAVVARIPTAAAPYVIRYDPVSRRLFAVAFEGDAVTIIDPVTRSATATLTGFSKPRDIVVAGA